MNSIKNILRRPTDNMTQNMLNAFFLPEDQDAFARSQGWEDAAQMAYYEDMARQEDAADEIARSLGYESAQAITDELNRQEAQFASAQDNLFHELAKVDSREVYEEPCPLDAWYDTGAELD